MQRTRVWALAVVGLVCAAALAATGYRLTCAHDKCKFETRVTFGETKITNGITGWCVKCAAFRTLRWRIRGGELDKEPAPLGSVWDSETGTTKRVFACPECQAPMLEIAGADKVKHCPKCGRDKVVLRAEMALD